MILFNNPTPAPGDLTPYVLYLGVVYLDPGQPLVQAAQTCVLLEAVIREKARDDGRGVLTPAWQRWYRAVCTEGSHYVR